eukprot:TRINITY_DN16680_c0_g1_i1.p1 TRINITY_DN16680_c0_g1~~TRINITY_DN16680_c0_g1_i1.p1  ORF type:complete len:245 (+),score=56.51 TRINITY_DN16680_c0_g1_i1:66-800(+)
MASDSFRDLRDDSHSGSSSIISGPQLAERQTQRFPLCVMGRSGVGKSALTLRYAREEVVREHEPTIEDLHLKYTKVGGSPACLEILDTAGQETYSTLHRSWLQHGKGFIFVFSLVDRQTFDGLQTFKDELLEAYRDDPPPSVIVANKADIDASQWVVSEDEMSSLRLQWPRCLQVVQTSALNGANVAEAFEVVCLAVKEREEERKRSARIAREAAVRLQQEQLSHNNCANRCRLAQCADSCSLQ